MWLWLLDFNTSGVVEGHLTWFTLLMYQPGGQEAPKTWYKKCTRKIAHFPGARGFGRTDHMVRLDDEATTKCSGLYFLNKPKTCYLEICQFLL